MINPYALPATNRMRPIPAEHLITEPLSAEEAAWLSADPRLAGYPRGDYLDRAELGRLAFVKWCRDRNLTS